MNCDLQFFYFSFFFKKTKLLASFCLLLTFLLTASFTSSQSLETVIQKGHELAVFTLAISPDSNYVATGSKDKSIKLWEMRTGREVRSFLGHQASVTSLTFTKDGRQLVSGSSDHSAKIWEVSTGKQILSIAPVENSWYSNRYNDVELINDIAIDPKGKFLVTLGQMLYVWSLPAGKLIKEVLIDQGNQGANDVSISPNGEWLAIGEDNNIASVYKTANWEQVYTFEYTEIYSSCGGCQTYVDFSKDSKLLLKASRRGELASYELSSGKLVKRFNKSLAELNSFNVSADGRWIATGTPKEVTIFDVQKGDSVKTINPRIESEINQTKFSIDSKRILFACDNNTVLIYDNAKNKRVAELTGFLNQRDKGGLNYDPNSYWDSYIAKYIRFKNSLLVSRDNKTLLKGKFGEKIKRWDIATGKTEMEYTGHSKAALCYKYSRDGKTLISGGGDGTIIIWNASTGDTIRTIKSYREPVFDVSFSNDETKIVSTSWEGVMKIHDVTTGKRLELFNLEKSAAYLSIFSRNDLYIITANLPKGGLQMREIDSKEVIREFVGHSEVVSAIQLTQDGRKLLSASWDGSIRLWDIATGLMDRKFNDHQGGVYAAIFNNAEKNIFSGGADRVIRMWDVATGKVVKTFAGHQGEVTSLQLTSDEKMLISHSLDGSTKFWDLNSGKEFFEHIHFGEKDWMVKSPEGYFNGTQDARKFIHFVEGVKTYSVDQFFNEFYRPDLLPKIFQNRGGDDGYKGIQGKLQKSPPPTVKLAAVLSTESGKADVYVKIQDNGAGVDQFKLFHNGKSVSIDRSLLKLPNGKDQSTTYRQTIPLVGGTNTFSAIATNKDKIESDPNPVDLFSETTGKTSKCFLLAVGINQYKNPRLTLNYAKPDAESFEKMIGEKGNALYKNLEVHTLYDVEATRSAILSKLDELAAKVSQEDVFIFYYAGHGSMVDDRFFFIPSESLRLYDLSSLQREAIEGSVIQEKFKNIHALKQLIVMDACQSGGSVELLATRGAAEEKAIAQLSRSAGIHVMASAGSEQFATEFAELGHGLFTYLLIKGLSGDADGSPKDGKVTIYELKSYLDDQVPEMTRKLKGKPQYPYTFSRGQDFPLVIEE